jgi:hypothetical protein
MHGTSIGRVECVLEEKRVQLAVCNYSNRVRLTFSADASTVHVKLRANTKDFRVGNTTAGDGRNGKLLDCKGLSANKA